MHAPSPAKPILHYYIYHLPLNAYVAESTGAYDDKFV